MTPTAAPPVETLYNSDAFPRWTKGAPYTLPFTRSDLPIGIQIVGAVRADSLVLIPTGM